MASNSEHPDDPYLDLERVAAALEEELAMWRRRTLKAEADLAEMVGREPVEAPSDPGPINERVASLEAENQGLRHRIEQAREQLELLKTRLRFVGDQVAGGHG